MTIFTFSFDDNATFHDDLVLRLGHFERRCDSYYLVNDNNLLPEQRNSDKVRAVLVRLLQQWSNAAKVLAPGGQTYLPYEFDDQATGWIRVLLAAADTFELFPVWSTLEGWAISPSAYGEALSRIGVTTPVWKDLQPVEATRGEVLAAITRFISDTQSGTPLIAVRSANGSPAHRHERTTVTAADAVVRRPGVPCYHENIGGLVAVLADVEHLLRAAF